MKRNRDFYSAAITIILLPKEAPDPKKKPPVPPYYQLHTKPGYTSNDLTQGSFLEFNTLYPTMEYFTPERRSAWFKRTPAGHWGSRVDDVLRIFIEYQASGENDEGIQSLRAIRRDLGKFLVETSPDAELASRIQSLKVYRRTNARSELNSYVYTQSDGRIVVVQCTLGCMGRTTWNNKLRIEYEFPKARLIEMADIDVEVNRLIDSFKPTFIAQGN